MANRHASYGWDRYSDIEKNINFFYGKSFKQIVEIRDRAHKTIKFFENEGLFKDLLVPPLYEQAEPVPYYCYLNEEIEINKLLYEKFFNLWFYSTDALKREENDKLIGEVLEYIKKNPKSNCNIIKDKFGKYAQMAIDVLIEADFIFQKGEIDNYCWQVNKKNFKKNKGL